MTKISGRDIWRISKFIIPLLLIITGFVILVIHSQGVRAVSNSGPDRNEFSNTPMSYVLANNTSISTTSIVIPVYIKGNGSVKPVGQILTIGGGNFCSQGRFNTKSSYGYDQVFGATAAPANGEGVSTYSDGLATVVGKSYNNGTCFNSLSLPLNNFTYDGTIGYWVDMLTAKYTTAKNIQNGFTVSIPGQGLVGYSSNGNSTNFAVQQNATSGYHDYHLPFAPDCNLGSGTQVVQITIKDPDNGTAGLQPQKFTMTVTDTVSGAALPLTANNVFRGTSWQPSSGNGITDVIKFTVTGGHKYTFNLKSSGVYFNNILQFRLPYDSINSKVVCSYGLDPTTSVSATSAAPGATVTFGYNVNNSGAIYSDNPTAWAIKQIVYPPASANVPPPRNDSSSCARYPGNSSCTTLQSGSSTGFRPGNSNSTLVNPVAGTTDFKINAVSGTLTIPANAPLGTRYCRLLAVSPGQKDTNGAVHTDRVPPDATGPNGVVANNRWGTLSCVKVTVSPVVYFSGGDLWAGGKYNPGNGVCTTNAQIYAASNAIGVNTYISSNTQLGALATAAIRGFGSAGTVWKGSAAASLGYDSLLFSNTAATPGNSGMSHCLTDFYKATGGSGTDQTINVDQVPDGSVLHYRNVTLQTSNPGALISGSITIIADGTVVINSNLKYNQAPVGNIASLPRLTVASQGNMTITNGVQEINGVYQTRGTLYTCASTPVNSTSCPTQLTVNGAIIADHVAFRRTGGAVNSPLRSAQAAEYFNFTPDTILGNYGHSIVTGQIQTDQETELPPLY